MSNPRKEDPKTKRLFVKPQSDLFKKSLEEEISGSAGPVECLGMTFESDEARREFFLEKLREKLKDPEFRQTPGFPKGEDEDILRISDPPYYTACPNPFLEDFVRCYGKPYDPEEEYHREPFAIDVSVGKTDALYRAHSYHTKVPHLAIVPSILHYTEPGDIVLDGFCGSGMTGVAAQWCGTAPAEYRKKLEKEWAQQGWNKPQWGARKAILGDLGPAATFIAANYNIPFDIDEFAAKAEQLLGELWAKVGWMYEILHTDGTTKGRINFTVWSEVFSCPECSGDIDFVAAALDPESKRTRRTFDCPGCKAHLSKAALQRNLESTFDALLQTTVKRARFHPVLVNYSVGSKTFERPVEGPQRKLLERIEEASEVPNPPVIKFPYEDMWEAPRLLSRGITHTHQLYLPRPASAFSLLWSLATAESDHRTRSALLYFVEQAVLGMSMLARYAPTHYSQVNRYLNGTYYVGSQIVDVSPWYILEGKLQRLKKVFQTPFARLGFAAITTGDSGHLPVESSSVDYVFTDPPFGDNYPYAELNLLVEAWHRVFTDPRPEAIVDRSKKNSSSQKGLHDYQLLMQHCFNEYYRVLKPGRWMTVVFSNSKNSVWRAIQESLGTAGFVVGDVRTLDKVQRTLKQVSSSAVKQDLVISAYKPTDNLVEVFQLQSSTAGSVWRFVREHLSNLPIFVSQAGEAEVIVERTPQMLHDRMIAFHVQRGAAVPLDTGDFLDGVAQRFPERDGMYFLPEQVAEYDKKRAKVTAVEQLTLFPSDEVTAIQWLRQQLQLKPQTQQDLTPVFHKEIHNWAKHEKTIDIHDLLEQNFLKYDGSGPVPSQIHSYLSTNFKDLRNLEKEDPKLKAKGIDRWYVPSPERQGDLEKLREKNLLKIFEEYKSSPKKKIKTDLRTEAIRAGFKAAYDANDYQAIIDVANKIPENVLQEDEKLLMYYDVALTRLGED